MLPITKKGLMEKQGKQLLVTREEGKYRVSGIMTYQMTGGRDYFFVESKDDSLILRTGDEIEEVKPKDSNVEFDVNQYSVDLTE